MSAKIAIDRDRIADFCRRHHIRKLSLFGAVLTDEFRPDSDVDVLVDFEPGEIIGFRILDIEDELSGLLGGTASISCGRNISTVGCAIGCWPPLRHSMQKDDLVYVGHMLDMARKAIEKIDGRSRDYLEVDYDLVWDVVSSEVPPLVTQLEQIAPCEP
jgi:predicted nucleotidyltransferase